MTLLEAVRLIKEPENYNVKVEYGGMKDYLTANVVAELKDKKVQEIRIEEQTADIVLRLKD